VGNASQRLLLSHLTSSSRKRSVVILELRAELHGWVRATFLDCKLIIWAAFVCLDVLLESIVKSCCGGGGRGRRIRWLTLPRTALVRAAGLTPTLTPLTFVLYFAVPQSILWFTLALCQSSLGRYLGEARSHLALLSSALVTLFLHTLTTSFRCHLSWIQRSQNFSAMP